MKSALFAATLALAFGTNAVSQCDATISPRDTVSDVRNKLACFAAENAQLKKALETKKAARIFTAPADSSLSSDTCKNKTIASVIKRGGQVIEQGDDWVDLEIAGKGVMVLCKLPENSIVIVTGQSATENGDLAVSLRSEIFP